MGFLIYQKLDFDQRWYYWIGKDWQDTFEKPVHTD
jgi:hypothetical protein